MGGDPVLPPQGDEAPGPGSSISVENRRTAWLYSPSQFFKQLILQSLRRKGGRPKGQKGQRFRSNNFAFAICLLPFALLVSALPHAQLIHPFERRPTVAADQRMAVSAH
jgi:hypothetical protein